MKNKENEEVAVQLLTVHQICNELRIIESSRAYAEKRFKGQEKTLEEWKEAFKKVRLDF